MADVSSESGVRAGLVKAKRKLENDMQKLMEGFETETGLSVQDIKLSRGNVSGNSSPALSRVEINIVLICG